MKKPVLLVNAPFYDLYGSLKSAVSYYFPLGIGYLASYLEKHGYEVDLLIEGKNTLIPAMLERLLDRKEYLFVGVSSMTAAFPGAVRIAETVRRKCPSTPIILGGPHASGLGPSLLEEQKQFDFLCIGEGELTILELAGYLEKGAPDLKDIDGLAWRNAQGDIISNALRPFYSKIDEFPFPARHLIDFTSFSVSSHVTAGGGMSTTMITSRGCPYECTFCSAHLTVGKKYRFRSEDSIIEELKMLVDRYNINYVFFQDDTLTVVRKRIESLCRRMVDENLGIRFGCFSRAEVFDDDLARILSSAGCRLVVFGTESGVPEVLKKISKRISPVDARKAIASCKRYGIQSYTSFVVGFPFETEEQVRQTIAFGKSLDASRVTFNPLVPFPGYALYDPLKHKPSDVDGWARFLTTGFPLFDMIPRLPPRRLKAIVDRAHLEYYLHPKLVLQLIQEIQSPGEACGVWPELPWGFLVLSSGDDAIGGSQGGSLLESLYEPPFTSEKEI